MAAMIWYETRGLAGFHKESDLVGIMYVPII